MAMVVMASIQFRIIVISGANIVYTNTHPLCSSFFSLFHFVLFVNGKSYHRRRTFNVLHTLRLYQLLFAALCSKVLSLVASCCNTEWHIKWHQPSTQNFRFSERFGSGSFCIFVGILLFTFHSSMHSFLCAMSPIFFFLIKCNKT